MHCLRFIKYEMISFTSSSLVPLTRTAKTVTQTVRIATVPDSIVTDTACCLRVARNATYVLSSILGLFTCRRMMVSETHCVRANLPGLPGVVRFSHYSGSAKIMYIQKLSISLQAVSLSGRRPVRHRGVVQSGRSIWCFRSPVIRAILADV